MVGVWASAPSIPSARKGAVGGGNRTGARVTGGIDNTSIISGSTFVYNGTTWSTSAPLITPRAYHAGGDLTDAIVYGGVSSSGGRLSSTEKFNGTSWESAGNMLYSRSYHMGYGRITNAFAAGGSGGADILYTAEKFNGSSWSAIPSLPQPREMGAAVGLPSTSSVCLGGFNGSSVLNSTVLYNGEAWVNGPTMLVARISLAAGGMYNNMIAFGGSDLSGNFYGDTEVYTGDVFTAESSMLLARAELAGDGNSANAISIGGARVYGCLDTVEIFYIDSRAYPVDFLTQKQFSKGFSSGAFIAYPEKDRIPYRMSISKLVKYEANYGANLKLRILPGARPVVSTLVKLLAYQIADVRTRLVTLDLAHKIDYSTGDELDTKWGKLYNLPRFTDEDDVQYRKRLKTYVLSQVGSGTKETCQRVLDEIAGKVGSTEISIYEPGKVYIRWKDVDAIRFVMENQSLVEYALRRTLAAGVDWKIYFGLADYTMGYGPAGTGRCDFDTDVFLLDTFLKTYGASALTALVFNKNYIVNVSIWGILLRSYRVDAKLKFVLHRGYLFRAGIASTKKRIYDADLLISYPFMRYDYPFDVITRRTIARSIAMRSYVSVSWIREMWLWTTFIKGNESSCSFSVTLVK